jgi:hypothetical protein
MQRDYRCQVQPRQSPGVSSKPFLRNRFAPCGRHDGTLATVAFRGSGGENVAGSAAPGDPR